MRNYCRSDLKIASKVAIRSWLKEGQLSEKIQKSRIIDESLGREWLNYWMLARTGPLENRVPLYQYMTRARRRLLSSNLSGAQAYRLVQCIANDGANLNGTTGRLLSLVSKLAFSCQPELFAPYDKRARAALCRLLHGVVAASSRLGKGPDKIKKNKALGVSVAVAPKVNLR